MVWKWRVKSIRSSSAASVPSLFDTTASCSPAAAQGLQRRPSPRAAAGSTGSRPGGAARSARPTASRRAGAAARLGQLEHPPKKPRATGRRRPRSGLLRPVVVGQLGAHAPARWRRSPPPSTITPCSAAMAAMRPPSYATRVNPASISTARGGGTNSESVRGKSDDHGAAEPDLHEDRRRRPDAAGGWAEGRQGLAAHRVLRHGRRADGLPRPGAHGAGRARGAARAPPSWRRSLRRVQNELFNLGSDLATLPEDRHPKQPVIEARHVEALEQEIDAWNEHAARAAQLRPARRRLGGRLPAPGPHRLPARRAPGGAPGRAASRSAPRSSPT